MIGRLSVATFMLLHDEVEADSGANLRSDYSGRAMYGALCLALVCDQPTELVQFVLTLTRVHDEHDDVNSNIAQRLVQELSAFIVQLESGNTPTCQDNMGHGLVYYWPGVAVER